jgi:hypothetical protein
MAGWPQSEHLRHHCETEIGATRLRSELITAVALALFQVAGGGNAVNDLRFIETVPARSGRREP